jgi:glutathione S-transferase
VAIQAVLEFLKGRINNSLGILDKRLSSKPYLLGSEPTIADGLRLMIGRSTQQ